MLTVNVARDFTRFPAGRYKKNGATSGEAFRERFLHEPLRLKNPVVVELDGTVGYGSSFLEEAFGGAVRFIGASAEDALSLIKIRSVDQSLVDEITQYIRDAGVGQH